jgi:hypothetical protein
MIVNRRAGPPWAAHADLGHRLGQATALNELGVVQRLTGDYPAAAADHQPSGGRLVTALSLQPRRRAERGRASPS